MFFISYNFSFVWERLYKIIYPKKEVILLRRVFMKAFLINKLTKAIWHLKDIFTTNLFEIYEAICIYKPGSDRNKPCICGTK